jgi:aminopeptidase-like protein
LIRITLLFPLVYAVRKIDNMGVVYPYNMDTQESSTIMGSKIYKMIEDLFPICRSITGEGVRKTLKIIKNKIPVDIVEVPSGTKIFDWEIPMEWNVNDAYVSDETGKKVIDFNKNNLHLVGYSIPVAKTMDLDELNQHLYSIESLPHAIPYVTSYYKERWGFCISHSERLNLKPGKYKVYIDSELKKGSLTYGELVIPGETEKEVFFSTYLCHPSMANNELSGPSVTTYLAKWILKEPRKYTYRIIFIPETIGSLTYLSKNLKTMKKNIIAGFNVTCVGDERAVSFLPSRKGNTLADKVALNVLSFSHPGFKKYSFLDRGSDERQYCSPGVDLPVVSIMKSKYGTYPEYHTSLDNLQFITPNGLRESYELLKKCVNLLESNKIYKIKCLGEPQLGRRGLYPTISSRDSGSEARDIMNVIAYADGNNDLIEISNKIILPFWEILPIIDKLIKNDLFEIIE